jgi:hypothetical protein
MDRKGLRKKYIRDDDLFDAKITVIKDKSMLDDVQYHIRTGKCPYSKGECSPVECKYGKDGMSRCPIHQGQGP